MSIYTKKGDKGETGIYSGKRISKDDILIETLGNFDVLEKELPPLDHFIIPKGQLMYGRALVRRAERSLVKLSKSQKVNSEILKYVNRLSDYLFMLARKS